MSPEWGGWIVLHAMVITAFIAGAGLVMIVCMQTVARWLLRRWWGRS